MHHAQQHLIWHSSYQKIFTFTEIEFVYEFTSEMVHSAMALVTAAARPRCTTDVTKNWLDSHIQHPAAMWKKASLVRTILTDRLKKSFLQIK